MHANNPVLNQLKLLVIDLDGTALGGSVPYVRFTEEFSAFLDELNAAGCKWAINTTWDVKGQWDLVMGSPVKSRPAYFCAEYGLNLARWGEQEPVMVEDYCARMQEQLKALRASSIHPVMRKLVNTVRPARFMFYGHVIECTVMDEDIDKLKQLYDTEIAPMKELVTSCRDNRFTLRPAFLNKSLAHKEILRMEGLSPEQVAVAGDGDIDLPMMADDCARWLVCPANASDRVKARVREAGGCVSEHEFAQGVIEAFARLQAIPA